MIVEVCANSLQSALNAQRAGAHRIELCAELGVGGITPSYGLLQKVRDAVSLPIHVLIRPRSGDFTYSGPEYEVMCRDIVNCARMGFDGVVTGVLQEDLRPDLRRTEGLMAIRGNMHFTFHRAFDWAPDPMNAFIMLENMGVDAILSSGQAASAEAGMPLLLKLLKTNSHCTIMPGAGINAANAMLFREKGFRAIHLSGVALESRINASPPLSMISPAYITDGHVPVSQEAVIRAVVESVK
jgi:copper homeostasis protein